MKYTKKLLSLVLVLVLALALAVPGFAATITIENYKNGETYTAYKIFNYTSAGTKYAYTMDVNESLKGIVEGFKVAANGALDLENGTQVFTTAVIPNDATKLRVDVASVFTADATKEAAAAAFASYLSTRIASAGVEGVTNNGTNTIQGLEKGYYFVDTTLGSLCSLFNADTTQELVEKNSVPSLEKYVKEDSKTEDAAWGETATADYGQSVEFWLSVNTGTNGAASATGVDDNYKIEDVIPTNMTLDVEDGNYVSINGWIKDTDYTETYKNNTLTITLLKTGKLATLGQDADIEIYYSATLNNTAVSGTKEQNTATLTYKNQSDDDSAYVVTYKLGGDAEGVPTITKVDGTPGADNRPLEGVKFVLMKGNKYAVLENDKLVRWTETESEATALETNAKGNIYAYGLDADTYTLKETYTLPGYNLLNDTITAVIAEDGSVSYRYSKEDADNAEGSIEIVNQSGTVLPGTGGMGTTIFYTLGGVLVVGAAILLVTKKRVHDVEG